MNAIISHVIESKISSVPIRATVFAGSASATTAGKALLVTVKLQMKPAYQLVKIMKVLLWILVS